MDHIYQTASINIPIIAGILGSAAMLAFMWFIHGAGLANGDMVRALGSIVTKKRENALVPGLVIYFIFGIIFAIFYGMWVSFIGTTSLLYDVLACLTAATFHGLVVSFFLVVLVAEYHPLQEFRKAGLGVALTHFVGHLVYGLIIGIVFGMTSFHFAFIRPVIGG